MKRLFIFFLFFFSNIAFCNNKDFIANKIYFEGLQRISLNTVLLKIPIHIGDVITKENISNIISSLFATGNFEKIILFRNKNTLIIQVVERPIISNIIFTGNKTLKNIMLKHILDEQGVQIGEIFNYAIIFNIEKNLENLFYNNGKYNAKVKAIITSLPYNRVDINFTFIEGESARIKQINIIGNQAFTDKELVICFNLKEIVPWWNFFKKNNFQEQDLLSDLDNLRKFYLKRGYARFSIDSTHISFTPDKKNIFITINITEGSQYKLSGAIINTNIINKLPNIKKIVKIKTGELYNGTKITKIENKIKRLLSSYGYAYPHVVFDLKFNDINKTIKIYISIYSGNRFYVRHINFNGNDISKDVVLRREIRQMESSWLNGDFIHKGQDYLNKLGYFDSVDFKIQRVPDTIDQVDILYTVQEHNTGNINVGFGVDNDSVISLILGIHQNNWLGTGNSLGINSTKNSYRTYAELSMIDPYFTINAISLSSKIFFNKFDADAADLSNYDLRSYGFDVKIGVPFRKNHTLNIGLNYTHDDLSNMQPQIMMWRYLKSIGKLKIKNSSNINIKKFNKYNFSINDLFFTLGWNFNDLDHGLFPTVGSYVDLSYKVSTPCSDNEYYQIILDANHYISLDRSKKWVLINRLRTGYSGVFYDSKEVPFYDYFYGNNFIVRGFRTNTIGPKAVYYYNFNDDKEKSSFVKKSNDAVGGNAMIIASTELVLPNFFIKKKYENLIRMSFFIDAGTIWDTRWRNTPITRVIGVSNYNNPNRIRISSGFSVQWMTPIGPMIFSYTEPIKKYFGDKLERFQFSFGKVW